MYLLAHTYKHVQQKGTGLRALADIIVMNRTFGNLISRDYIRDQLSQMGILEFAESLEFLARAVYDGSPITDEDLDVIVYMMFCGAYGTEAESVRIRMRRAVEEGSRPRLAVFRRFFSPETVRGVDRFASFERHRWLRPLFPFARVFDFARRALRDPRGQLSKIAALLGGARGK